MSGPNHGRDVRERASISPRTAPTPSSWSTLPDGPLIQQDPAERGKGLHPQAAERRSSYFSPHQPQRGCASSPCGAPRRQRFDEQPLREIQARPQLGFRLRGRTHPGVRDARTRGHAPRAQRANRASDRFHATLVLLMASRLRRSAAVSARRSGTALPRRCGSPAARRRGHHPSRYRTSTSPAISWACAQQNVDAFVNRQVYALALVQNPVTASVFARTCAGGRPNTASACTSCRVRGTGASSPRHQGRHQRRMPPNPSEPPRFPTLRHRLSGNTPLCRRRRQGLATLLGIAASALSCFSRYRIGSRWRFGLLPSLALLPCAQLPSYNLLHCRRSIHLPITDPPRARSSFHQSVCRRRLQPGRARRTPTVTAA